MNSRFFFKTPKSLAVLTNFFIDIYIDVLLYYDEKPSKDIFEE